MGLLKARNTTAEMTPEPACDSEPLRLDSADPMIRRRAVQAMAGDPGCVDTLVGLLGHEHDHLVRQAAFIVLSSLNSSAAAEGVSSLLSDADAALRNGALETLSAMPAHAWPLLATLGRSDDPDVRIFAVLLATELDRADASDWMIALAEDERDPNVCTNLAEALGGSGRAEAIPALEAIAAHFPEEPFVAFAVDTAIQRLREA